MSFPRQPRRGGVPQQGIGIAVDRGLVHKTPPMAGEQSEEWLTGRQYLDMSLLDKMDQEQEAELRLNRAECGREVAAA